MPVFAIPHSCGGFPFVVLKAVLGKQLSQGISPHKQTSPIKTQKQSQRFFVNGQLADFMRRMLGIIAKEKEPWLLVAPSSVLKRFAT